jgi:hypothetical protein
MVLGESLNLIGLGLVYDVKRHFQQ